MDFGAVQLEVLANVAHKVAHLIGIVSRLEPINALLDLRHLNRTLLVVFLANLHAAMHFLAKLTSYSRVLAFAVAGAGVTLLVLALLLLLVYLDVQVFVEIDVFGLEGHLHLVVFGH